MKSGGERHFSDHLSADVARRRATDVAPRRVRPTRDGIVTGADGRRRIKAFEFVGDEHGATGAKAGFVVELACVANPHRVAAHNKVAQNNNVHV